MTSATPNEGHPY